ncbi:MAG: gamma-glutamylcyclotransferase [Proteobacteria bacterium]|nr:gamma-glutamylcyclotransferase [Pseudomonadota bacterium]
MKALYYLAYGSNLHPLRLMQRVPSAKSVDVIELAGKRVNFHKRSVDRSGKCNLIDENSVSSYGVLYEFAANERPALDAAEGLGSGYREALLQFTCRGELYTPYVYVAESAFIDPSLKPYHWYRQLVIAGAQYHGFPSAYLSALEKVEAIPDPDSERATRNAELLVQLAQYSAVVPMPPR